MIKLFNVNFATIGFTIIAITLYIDYEFLQNSNDPWYCISCYSQIFPFNSMKSNQQFSIYVSNFHNNNKPGKTNTEGSLLLKPSENLKLLVNQFNNKFFSRR